LNAAGSGDTPDHLVFVVHGVGDPQPADALTSLVDSYCAHTGARPSGPRISSAKRDKADVAGADEFVRTFPVNQIDTVLAASDGRTERTRFVEVYWGDLSRVKGSAGGLLLGTIDLVFGLRHIVKAARLEIEALTLPWWITRLAVWAGEAASASQGLIRGPLLALNLFAAIVVALFVMDAATRLPLSTVEAAVTVAGIDRAQGAFGPCVDFMKNPFSMVLSESSRLTPEAVYCSSGGFGLAISGVVGLVLGVVLVLLALARGWSIAMASCLFAAGAACLVWCAVSVQWNAGVPTYARFIEDLTGMLSLGATLVGVLVVGMLVLSLLAWVLAWMFKRGKARPLRRALTVMNVCTTLSTALFVLLLMVAWAALSRQIDIPVLARRIEGGLHLFIVVWLTFVFIGLAYGSIVMRSWWRKRRSKDNTAKFPRYIVGFEAVTAVIVSALMWPLVFVPTVASIECNEGQRLWSVLRVCSGFGGRSSSSSAWILDKVHVFDGFVSVAIMASIGAVILLFAARAHFGTALDIVLDVVSHFSLSHPPTRDKMSVWQIIVKRLKQTIPNWPLKKEKPALDPEYAIWQTIVRRFCVVVEDALANCAARRVSVLAHSQGTMIALEGLGAIKIDRKGNFPKDMQTVKLPDGCGKVQLVTLGCPLSHLYVHYFPEQYKIEPVQGSLLRRWINIYRADDFVGREVCNCIDSTHPLNIAVGPRGHVDYWPDREVLEHLVDSRHGLL
jgi:mannose/fructose/N-acetylgalactosamine-specific phosphotransferase system component IID